MGSPVYEPADDGRVFSEDLVFSTAKQFVDFFLYEEQLNISSYLDTCNALAGRYVFRGQKDRNFRLLPTAHRYCSNNPFHNHSPQLPDKQDADYLGMQLHAEQYVAFKFLEYADSVGIATPLDYQLKHLHFDLLQRAFNDVSYNFSDGFPDPKMYGHFAFAQHHGIPTRFLDWSESALVAAYFAAEEHVFGSTEKLQGISFMSVYCMLDELIDRVEGLELVQGVKATHPYLKAQQGVFTVVPLAQQYYNEHKVWPSVETIVEYEVKTHPFPSHPFIRVSLPVSEARALMQILFSLGISKLSLMPSLANAAEHFAYKKQLFSKA